MPEGDSKSGSLNRTYCYPNSTDGHVGQSRRGHHYRETWPGSSLYSSRGPRTDMSRPGIEPRRPAWEASTLEKSHLDSLYVGFTEPLLMMRLLHPDLYTIKFFEENGVSSPRRRWKFDMYFYDVFVVFKPFCPPSASKFWRPCNLWPSIFLNTTNVEINNNKTKCYAYINKKFRTRKIQTENFGHP
jgi:hypothetical protein